MNRRAMLLSGAAVAMGQGMAQTTRSTKLSLSGGQHISNKRLLKYSRNKVSYKVPKSESKTVKYVNFLTALLALTPDQVRQATEIFRTAATTRATVRGNLKIARQGLSDAVINNSSVDIDQASAKIGALKAQFFSAGANANASFYRILTPDQQSKLTQFHS